MSHSTIGKQAVLAALFGLAAGFILSSYFRKGKKTQPYKKIIVTDLIGSSPLIYLPSLSKAVGCEIYAKIEYVSPFGSSKDRPVKYMLEKVINQYKLKGQKLLEVVQASSGSTALSLVQLCKIHKIKATLFLPNDLAPDKYSYLETLGANIIKVPQVSIVDPNHFYNKAKDYAKLNNAYFLNQFDNLNNCQVHERQTGPQILTQMNNHIDAFVCSAGTGGTIAGVSRYLKKATNKKTAIVLADPEGSGLYAKIKYGALFTIQEREGHRLKNPFDTVIEGIGLNRPTKNFDQSIIDEAYKVTDIEALHMSNYMIQNEGLFLGGSCCINLCAAVKYGRKKEKSRIVTILHDSGNRYLKKFYSREFLEEKRISFKRRKYYPESELDFVQ